MKFSHFFIDRPIFASVIWIITVIIGALAYLNLPVEQYPKVAPPTIIVSGAYPGANADTVAKTVATPLEQEINGVENMLYMSSQSTNNGDVAITVTFKIGTNLDIAQVLVQNRVSVALPHLPQKVQALGVTTKKNSPDLMMVVNLYSPDGTFDQTYMGNYAKLQLVDQLSRVEGVGDIRLFGASEYAMRIWLDPDRMQNLGISAGDIVAAMQTKNVQVASGTLNQQPEKHQMAFEINVQTEGRLIQPEEFGDIVIKTTSTGKIVRVKDIGRVELASDNYATRGYLGTTPAIALPISQLPGSNALKAADGILEKMKELSPKFPKGLEYKIVYNPTEFVAQSIDAVYHTIFEAVILVVLVIILFLQSWRAAIIPVVAIPVSLIGTFAVMSAIGFSLNNLTLFGLVLAIGIVVDDAIVVVENMERLMALGLQPKEAAKQTMDEVGGALVAIGLVLIAVFLPTTFITGISGKFYQQFGIVIAVATAFSVAVSLTLSPALAAILLRPGAHHGVSDHAPGFFPNPFAWLFHYFNAFIEWLTKRYGKLTARTVRLGFLMLLIYAALMAMAGYEFKTVPSGFIPAQDQGYFIVVVQLPPGSSLERTDKVVQEVSARLLKVPGVWNTVGFAGFSGATFTSASNAGAIFPRLADFDERQKKHITYDKLFADVQKSVQGIDDNAMIFVIKPPPVSGIGNGGGFKMMVQDRGGLGFAALEGAVWQLAGAANQSGIASGVFSLFENKTPQLFLNIDREKAERLGVPTDRIFDALNVFLGSAYVNDFNYLGRTYHVTAQADGDYRETRENILRMRVPNMSGAMIPLGTFVTFEDRAGPSRVPRYNLYPSAELQGDTAPGHSSGEVLDTMEKLAHKMLPAGIDFEWTELAYQQKTAGNTSVLAFGMAVVFVFLMLAALYESWILPLSIILIVPMCLLSAISGVAIMGMDNNILTQIGLVVLIGLASKNAILIVEFAKEREAQGETRWQAAEDAAHLRLRPILMTSFAFILGVVPLVVAEGAGAEMRQALGVTVFAGMIGVTAFGLIFTPVFYTLCRALGEKISNWRNGHRTHVEPIEHHHTEIHDEPTYPHDHFDDPV